MVLVSAVPVPVPDTEVGCGGGPPLVLLKIPVLFTVAEVTPARKNTSASAPEGSVKGARHLFGLQPAAEGPAKVVASRHAVLDGERSETVVATSRAAPVAC